jgi:hypothetical protein
MKLVRRERYMHGNTVSYYKCGAGLSPRVGTFKFPT